MRIDISISELRRNGYTYNVFYNGEQITTDSFDPEFDACRVLFNRGITGKLTTYRGDKACMIFNIEKAACHRTAVNSSGTPAIRNIGVFNLQSKPGKVIPASDVLHTDNVAVAALERLP